MTGPDEVYQARRAAAVVRGQLTGNETSLSPLLVEVKVPESYRRADEVERCFLGDLVEGVPQEGMKLPPSDCPPFGGSDRIVGANTGQYRGQPFFYALVGLPTLIDSGAAAYLMRLIGVVATTALLASATVSVRRSQRSRLAWLALFGTVTPMTMYLSASTNPSAVEIAAALGVWATGMLLARSDVEFTRREVARFGMALIVLIGARGLGPAFAVLLLVLLSAMAGRSRMVHLARRVDVWGWAVGAGAMTVASAAWLWTIQRDFPLPDRPGSGWATAVSYLPFYLRQSVGVFGQNDNVTRTRRLGMGGDPARRLRRRSVALHAEGGDHRRPDTDRGPDDFGDGGGAQPAPHRVLLAGSLRPTAAAGRFLGRHLFLASPERR